MNSNPAGVDAVVGCAALQVIKLWNHSIGKDLEDHQIQQSKVKGCVLWACSGSCLEGMMKFGALSCGEDLVADGESSLAFREKRLNQ